MAQKDKVKELVGRGLDSYHTKSLQQIDRIEKKNKQQNHKISILSNELDNDYLTKTEEGSIVSLEHSKEGMVYLDELQGNTLVNYCTDGSKELTLNGDIDVEGTFVTTTEGVDNGLVDVYCEGNTLVGEFLRIPTPNLQGNDFDDFTIVDKNDYWECRGIANKDSVVMSVNAWSCELGLKALKEGVEYTVIVYDCPVNSMMKNYLIRDNNIGENFNTVIGTNKWKIIAKSDGLIYGFYSYSNNVNLGEECIINFPKKVLILEGDWTNKEIPPYFEGMKSVGQDDENGHKIEILSRNKNLWNVNEYGLSTGIYAGVQITKLENGFKLNGTSTSSFTRHSSTNYLDIFEKGKTYILTSEYFNFEITYANGTKNWRKLVTVTDDVVKVTCYLQWLEKIITFDNLILTPQIEEGSVATSYLAPSLNKKEILLNEPLRGLPNGTKDRIVKIGSKYFIERNCGCVTLDGNITWGEKEILNGVNRYRYVLPNANSIHIQKNAISDKYITTIGDENYEHLRVSNGWVWYYNTQDLTYDEVKSIFTSKPATLVYQLKTPIYEPLEIEPILSCYNDTTHISNNSLIPCTMKIKNSGYNAIIKPSTLYTVALDTNKSGTIGMNLGGVKGTTTNNVLTLTTPATLSDDSLRLYGKGIKGSKVRILEGDKTNWIPSHFEGMKSCFEDKVQEDGTYKMEILSNNRNLFDVSNTSIVENNSFHNIELGVNNGIKLTSTQDNQGWQFSQLKLTCLKPNTTYTLRCNITKSNPNSKPAIRIFRMLDNSDYGVIIESGSFTFKTPKVGTEYLRLLIYTSIDNVPTNQGDVVYFKDIQISEVVSEYVDYKSNKIQFLINEPLRSVPNGKKDKFVFRDGKLMIERNTKSVLFNGGEDWRYRETRTDGYCYTLNISDLKKYGVNSYTQGYVDRFFMRHLLPFGAWFEYLNGKDICLQLPLTLGSADANAIKNWLNVNNVKVVYEIEEPTYEEIPFELQKIILEGYENGTLFFDTNIPPTSTVTYAGETPIVKATKLNKTEVLNNTNDINDNIVPYLMDMDYRVVCLELATETQGVSMARLFGGVYEMLKRDILSGRLSKEEYGYRLADYFNAGKLTEEQVRELEDLR